MWKRDFLRGDDFYKMKDMVSKLKKHRSNEAGGNKEPTTNLNNLNKAKAVGARISIQQTQGSNNLIKKENPRKSYLNK